MADEKAAGNSPANSGGDNANKSSGRSNRRRSSRNRRRGRKPAENSTNTAPSTEGRSDNRTGNRSDNRSDNRSEPRGESRSSRNRQNASKGGGDKTTRDNRERRRRRRMRSKQRGQNETAPVTVGDTLKDLPDLVPAFVYTHVSRPAMRDGFEFRTEHFSKVTRKLGDFHIDLSPLYPEGGDEIKGVAYVPPVSESDRPVTDDRVFDDGGYDDEDDAEYERPSSRANRAQSNTENVAEEIVENPDWDAEESDDAARLDGATMIDGVIADEFNAELDDSVVDEYPEEDLDA